MNSEWLPANKHCGRLALAFGFAVLNGSFSLQMFALMVLELLQRQMTQTNMFFLPALKLSFYLHPVCTKDINNVSIELSPLGLCNKLYLQYNIMNILNTDLQGYAKQTCKCCTSVKVK